MEKPLILIVDDDESIIVSLGLLLKQAGYESVAAKTPAEAMSRLSGARVSLVLQDMNFSAETSGEEGLELLRRIKSSHPETPVLLITAWGSIELAVAGIKAGAADFITKPWSKAQILQSIGTAIGLSASHTPTRSSPVGAEIPGREEMDARFDFSGIIGENRRLLEVLDLVGKVSGTDASVLITGDSGVGKEVIAEAIHRNSPRREGPFVKVNLGGLSNTLFESEMFGHVRGAFTGAHRDRRGRFAAAEGGTILLDEIGELDPRNQVKMLRVLQDRTFEVLGSSETKTLDVRVISATNRNLEADVRSNRFREDLLYRLNLITLHVPSLAERIDDIPLLARHFLAVACETYGRPQSAIGEGAIRWLQAQEWPGNIRQMKHLLERTLLLTRSATIGNSDLERAWAPEPGGPAPDRLPPVGSMTMEDIERRMIEKSIVHHEGNLTRVAASLGLSRAALYRRLDKYGIRS